MADINSFAPQSGLGSSAKFIVAVRSHKDDPRSAAGGGDGLVRAFSSSMASKIAAEQRLAGARPAAAAHDQIGIRAADHDNQRAGEAGGFRFQESANGRQVVSERRGNLAL